jgi:putative oxidoreductase
MILKRLLLSNFSHVNVGLLLIRLGIGLSMLVFHGYGKLTGGPEAWTRIGANMESLGVGFAPAFWGLMAALSESVGSVLLMLGLFFRPATALLAFTMFVAVLRHLNLPPDAAGAGWRGASHALELLVVYVGLLVAGPGKYRLRLWAE